MNSADTLCAAAWLGRSLESVYDSFGSDWRSAGSPRPCLSGWARKDSVCQLVKGLLSRAQVVQKVPEIHDVGLAVMSFDKISAEATRLDAIGLQT